MNVFKDSTRPPSQGPGVVYKCPEPPLPHNPIEDNHVVDPAAKVSFGPEHRPKNIWRGTED